MEMIKLCELEFPMYSIVREKEGIPQNVKFLYEKIVDHPALIISVNEYNAMFLDFLKILLTGSPGLTESF